MVGRTAGNPLALVEIPRVLTRDQLAGRRRLPDPLPLSAELERILAGRLQVCETGLRTLALACAAEGSGSMFTCCAPPGGWQADHGGRTAER